MTGTPGQKRILAAPVSTVDWAIDCRQWEMEEERVGSGNWASRVTGGDRAGALLDLRGPRHSSMPTGSLSACACHLAEETLGLSQGIVHPLLGPLMVHQE